MKLRLIILLLLTSGSQLFSQESYQNDLDSLRFWLLEIDKLDMTEDYYEFEEYSINIERKFLELLQNKDLPLDSLDAVAPFGPLESDDKKFRIYQWEENTGGTYRPFVSIFCYQPDKDSRIVQLTDYDAGFSEIYEHYTECCGQRYVLDGSVRGCSYCFGNLILMIDVENGGFDEVSSCYLYDRDWSSVLRLDLENRLISFDFEETDISDLTVNKKGEEIYSLQEDEFKDLKFSRTCADSSKYQFRGLIIFDEEDLFELR